jgi:hypothetical protein
MKNFLYSLPVSLITNIAFIYLAYKYWSVPIILAYAIYIVFYVEKASEYRKQKKNDENISRDNKTYQK